MTRRTFLASILITLQLLLDRLRHRLNPEPERVLADDLDLPQPLR